MMRSTSVVLLDNGLENVAGDVAAPQVLSRNALQTGQFSPRTAAGSHQEVAGSSPA
jgi:hypothetical protein